MSHLSCKDGPVPTECPLTSSKSRRRVASVFFTEPNTSESHLLGASLLHSTESRLQQGQISASCLRSPDVANCQHIAGVTLPHILISEVTLSSSLMMRSLQALHRQCTMVQRGSLNMPDLYLTIQIKEGVICKPSIQSHLDIIGPFLPVVPSIWKSDEAQVLKPTH